ncbi:MAG: signal recognition particle protein [Candidatus Melainabacteria bacterium RIFCSPLOWO2_12_FULL_35_11]|nr:MAG: signal recognition particle protein [Candidatus Melainabacteria bacterium RIFCSPLOWO2_12_FULL_35_11]
MFNQLTDKFQNIFKILRSQSRITEENINTAIREIKRALIDADVSLRAIKTFTNKVHTKALGQEVLKGISPEQQFIKIVSDELTALLTPADDRGIQSSVSTGVILMLGLQGAGKTTTCAKLAKLLKKKGKNPLLVPLDLKRPAAIEQLKILGEQAGVEIYNVTTSVETSREAFLLAQHAINYAKHNNHDVIILDSAGRLQIDTEMMAELLLIDQIIQPAEKLLVIDSMIGQEAANIAAAFNTQIGITGIILTKLDGDARGGAALSVVEEIQKPIKLISMGEKSDDLQEFYPERMAGRILGMGDVLTLVEQAQEKIQEDEAEALQRSLSADFNFESFLQMQGTMSKFGNFSNIFNMMGMQGMLGQFGVNLNRETQEKMLSEGEVKMKKFKSAIESMTKEERIKPRILTPGRIRRIARGSGQKERDIDKLVNEFNKMKKVMDNIKPLMGMMQGDNMSQDLFKSLNPNKPPGLQGRNTAAGRLYKGFKPKKNK